MPSHLNPVILLGASLLPVAVAAPQPLASLQSRQIAWSNLLFGPITFPAVQVQNVSVTLINFNDEVFDISSISVFGDINDGGDCTATAEPEPAAHQNDQVVLGPGASPYSSTEIRDVQVTLVNFNDEVFDISSISVLGDINDGACSPAA